MSNRNLHTDKVEISINLLIETERAFLALMEDKESYLHKVFSDDRCYDAIKELKQVYNNYFNKD